MNHAQDRAHGYGKCAISCDVGAHFLKWLESDILIEFRPCMWLIYFNVI